MFWLLLDVTNLQSNERYYYMFIIFVIFVFIFVGLPNCGIQCYSTPWRIWSKAHDNLRSRALTREVSNSETLRRARFAQMARWPARIPEFVSSFCPSLKVWSRNRLKKTVMVFLQAHGFLESFRFLWQTQKKIHASGNGEMANSPPILISPAPWSNIIWLANGSFVLVVLALFFYLQKLRSQLGTRSWNLKTQHVSLRHGITTTVSLNSKLQQDRPQRSTACEIDIKHVQNIVAKWM